MYGGVGRLVVGALAAVLLVIGAETVNADYCNVGSACPCANLVCGGSGCTCSAWDSAWFACGGFTSCNSSGCEWDCPGAGGPGESCCRDYCPCG